MPSEPTTEEQWQARFDADFPHGANVTWVGRDWTEQVPWFQVIRMNDTHPLVFFDTFPPGRGRAKSLTLLTYVVFQDQPLMARVTFENTEGAMVWSAGLSPEMTRLMDAERAKLADLA